MDRDGDTVDSLLSAKRDHAAARAIFERAIDRHGAPEKITIENNTAAITSIHADSGLCIEVMHMIGKGQLGGVKDRASSSASQFYSLAF